MNRRSFLATLVGSTQIDYERLLWVHGKKLISIPSRSFVMFPGDVIAFREYIDECMRKAMAQHLPPFDKVGMQQLGEVMAKLKHPIRQLTTVDFRISMNLGPRITPTRIVSKEELKKIYG